MRSFLIPDHELILADIPSEADLAGHWREFALTFPGYEIWGPPDVLGAPANAASDRFHTSGLTPDDLLRLRSFLFFEQRRDHMAGGWGEEDLVYLGALVGAISDAVEDGRATSGPRFPCAFPEPPDAAEARKADWYSIRHNARGRFRTEDGVIDARGTVLAHRSDRPYLMRPGEFGDWEVLPFRDLGQREEYVRAGITRAPSPRTPVTDTAIPSAATRSGSLAGAFEALGRSEPLEVEARDQITAALLDLWGRVRQDLGSDRFDRALAPIRPGERPRRDDDHVWVQTNAVEESQEARLPNLTIEIYRDELTLNLVGWFDDQLAKVREWAESRSGRGFLRDHPDLDAVIFKRTGRAGKNGRVMWRGAPGVQLDRLSIAECGPAGLALRLGTLARQIDPTNEKLSLHIRRGWSPAEATEPQMVAITNLVDEWIDELPNVMLGGKGARP